MKRFIKSYMKFFGAFLAVILFLVAYRIGLIPAHFEVCERFEGGTESHCSMQPLAQGIIKLMNANEGAILSLATILIAWFTYQLRWATTGLKESTDKLWNAGEKQLRITQRSHIAVEPEGVIPLRSAPHTIGRINIKNVGHVPAKNVRWFMDQAESPNGTLRDFPIKESEMGQGNLVPQGITMFFSQNNAISNESADSVLQGASFYYIWGIVRYTDVFGGERFTRFCHRYSHDSVFRITAGPQDGHWGLTGKKAKYHQWGNDADEEQ